MAVGLPLKTTYADGDVYSASDVNDTNGTVNLVGQTNNFYAGKNKIINGDFRFNQRNFTSNTANNSYNFDRYVQLNGGTTGTLTITPQTFTLGAAPVSGYEGTNFVQCLTASGASTDTYAILAQKIESVRTLAGQTATISFWAKAASGTPKIGVEIEQFFGTGGSPSAEVRVAGGAVTLSTSWARYSVTVAVPSISGKTIGTNNDNQLGVFFWFSAGTTFASRASSIGLQNATFQMWGIQVEAGSTATAFQTATGTIQGELSACQRYYWKATSANNVFTLFALGYSDGPNSALMSISIPSYMRVFPTSIDFSNMAIQEAIGGALNAISSFTISAGGATSPNNNIVFQANTSGLTNGRTARLLANNSSSAFIGFNSEL